MRTRVVIVVCLLFVAGLALALPAIAQDGGTSAENDSVDNVTVGQSVSGFMQSTEASAESDVDQGVYSERYEAANESERAALVEERTGDLESDLSAVEQRIERLQAQRDEMNPTAYRAQMSAAAAQLQGLQTSANETERHAAESGVNDTRLRTLRNRASELSGQEVAAIARGLAGAGPDPANRSGPPENPGRGNDQGQPNGTPGDSGNDQGAPNGTPGNAGDGQGPPNGTSGDGAPGNSDDGARGNSSDDSNDGSDDAGNGQNPGNGQGTGNQDAGPADVILLAIFGLV